MLRVRDVWMHVCWEMMNLSKLSNHCVLHARFVVLVASPIHFIFYADVFMKIRFTVASIILMFRWVFAIWYPCCLWAFPFHCRVCHYGVTVLLSASPVWRCYSIAVVDSLVSRSLCRPSPFTFPLVCTRGMAFACLGCVC